MPDRLSADAPYAVGADAAEAMAALHAAAFPSPWSAGAIADLLASPGVFALACGAPPSGFILARAIAGEAEVLTLAVHPAHRRTGLASRLVEAAAGLAAAAPSASQVLWLEVAEDNAPARALYAGLGFEPVGRRPRYYARASGPAVDALLLQRRLNSGTP